MPTTRSHSAIGSIHASPMPADAGVVAQDVRGAEPLDREFGERGDVGLRGGVADARRDVAAVLGQPRRHLGEPRLVDVGQHHVHALGDEPLGQRQPDTARRAGDDRDLVP